MKRNFKNFATLTLGMSVGFAGLPTASAQQADEPQRQADPAKDQSQQSQRDKTRSKGLNTRLSNIIGMNVANEERDRVGTVNDIVLDANSGEIRYVAIAHGGFLGIGNDLFAVPWEAFEFQQADEPGEYYMVLDVREEKLKNAEGFDEDNWPNFADQTVAKQLDSHYGIDRSVERDREPLRGERQQLDNDREREGQVDESTRGPTIRSSQLTGMAIQNLQNEEAGSIHDIVVNTGEGKIRYLAVSYGGFLGIGDDLFAVPWKAFQFKPAQEEDADPRLVLDVTEEKLEGAEGFSEDNWPNFGDSEFTHTVDARYGVNDRAERR